MKIGVWLHDYFYRKHCGKPMYGKEEKGWFFLNMEEVCRVTPAIFEDLRRLGAECVEMGGSLARLKAMIPVLRDRGEIEMILHSEGDPSPDKCDSENIHTRKAATENIKRNIDIAVEIKVSTIVLHLSKYTAFAVEALQDCCQYAEKRKVTLAIENCGYGKKGITSIVKLMQEVNSESVEYTFDTGHANINGSHLECAKLLGEKIAHIHWHDNNGKEDQHLGPGMGNIDFNSLMRFLLKIDAKREKEITLTLECDKPIVNYEEELKKVKNLRENILNQ